MTALWVGAVISAIVTPHFLRLERLAPLAAVVIWLSALVLRALAVAALALGAALLLPRTELFALLTRWCWHGVVPLVSGHLGLSGHQVGDAATLAPLVVILGSVALALGAVAVAARSVRRRVERERITSGPRGSVVVGGCEVILAAIGLARPRIVVSAGALVMLDDAELAAGLSHEDGHIRRRHRFAMLLGRLCYAAARVLPGSARALSELVFHLERDADEYALSQRHNPLALASAICKAAGVQPKGVGLALPLGGPNVVRRVRALVDEPWAKRRRLDSARAAVLSAAAVCLSVYLMVLVITAAATIGDHSLTLPGSWCPA